MDWIREEEECDMLERFYREIVEVAIFTWMGPWQLGIRIGYVGYIHYYSIVLIIAMLLYPLSTSY